MAEVQSSTQSGEMTRLFVQFVMMQGQQALLALGRHPAPPPGAPPANLEVGKVLIDQLGMIREKTRGNLNAQEEETLRATLASLQIAFVEASGKR